VWTSRAIPREWTVDRHREQWSEILDMSTFAPPTRPLALSAPA
jgi:hypothetical protein